MTRLTQSSFWTAFSFGKSSVAGASLDRAQATTSDTLEKRLFCIELMIAAVIIGILSWPMLMGQVYIKDDLGVFHLPLRFFYAQSLIMGDNFTWFPNIWGGFYLHGEGQVGMYHPLHLILYSTLPFATAFNLELLLGYPFILGGTFLFLRRWDIRRDAAMFGALCFTFSGFNLLHHIHPNAISIVAHIPWVLLAIDVIMRTDSRRRLAFAKMSVALLTMSQLLFGYPQYVLLSTFVEVLYLVFCVLLWKGPCRLLSVGEAKFLGVLGGCIQLLPTWEALSDSLRADPTLAFRYAWSLHPANLVQFIAPYLFLTRVAGGNTHEFGLYPGAIAPVLGLWLLIRFKELDLLRRRLAIAAFALSALALVLAMGEHGFLYRVQAHLPLVGVFRVPARYILLLHFAMSIVAAIAFGDIANLVERGDRLKWRKLCPLILIPVASVSAAGFALWARAHPDLDFWVVHELAARVASPGYVLIGPVLLTLGTAVLIASARTVRYALVGIIVFAMTDQAVYGLSYVWSAPGPSTITSFVDSQPMPPEVSSHRVQFYQGYNNVATMKGVRLADGYAALSPKFQLDTTNYARLQVASVRWFQTPQGHWSRVERPMSRARLVTKIVVSAHPNDDIDNIDLQSTALVGEALQLPEGEPGEASIISDRPGKIKVITTATTEQLLVLSESYHEGWQAKIDGEACPVLRVYGDFMGCIVSAGIHIVDFTFKPQSLRLGSWLSAMGLGLIFLSFSLGSVTRSSPIITRE